MHNGTKTQSQLCFFAANLDSFLHSLILIWSPYARRINPIPSSVVHMMKVKTQDSSPNNNKYEVPYLIYNLLSFHSKCLGLIEGLLHLKLVLNNRKMPQALWRDLYRVWSTITNVIAAKE